MMQLTTTVLFIMLLCSLFGNIKGNLEYFCCSGVKSVSIVSFTSDNLPRGQYVNVNDSCNLFNPSKQVIILSHGFLSSPHTSTFSDLSKGLVQKGYTVLALDWSDAACYGEPLVNILDQNLPFYPCAALNVREVGNHLAGIIKSLIDVCKIPLSNFKLIGHSLGAHVCRFASKNLFDSGYGKSHLLIGIEPASPGFLDICKSTSFKSNAKRVVIFHTSALGLQCSLGHQDLWFNNGLGQPACGSSFLNSFKLKCSHSASVVYLTATLSNAFIGVPKKQISALFNILPGCSSNTTNCIAVDNRILDSNYAATGDYCVSVTSVYPYTTTNSKCQ